MNSIRRFGFDPNRIVAIILSHLHADHFGGLPSFILDAQLVSQRTRPLLIAGPKGLGARLVALMEAHFPGLTRAERRLPLELIEILPDHQIDIGSMGLRVSGYVVTHPSGTPSLAIDCGRARTQMAAAKGRPYRRVNGPGGSQQRSGHSDCLLQHFLVTFYLRQGSSYPSA